MERALILEEKKEHAEELIQLLRTFNFDHIDLVIESKSAKELIEKNCPDVVFLNSEKFSRDQVWPQVFSEDNQKVPAFIYVSGRAPVGKTDDFHLCHPIVSTDLQVALKVSRIKRDYEVKEGLQGLIHKKSGRFLLLGQFSAELVHDLANFNSVTSNSFSIIRKNCAEFNENSREKILKFSEVGARASGRIEEMVGRYKKLLSKSEGKSQNYSLLGVINEVVACFQSKIEQQQVKVFNLVKEDVAIEGEELKTVQALSNLLANSFAALEGLENPWIRIWTQNRKHGIELFVQDSGEGIAPDKVATIFEPFYSTKDFEDGMGLGLSFVKKNLEEQGATISYDITKQWTTFVIHFPEAKSKTPV